MKIALVGPACPLRGGIAQYLALLFQALSLRHEVRFYSFYRQYPSFLFPGRTQREEDEPALRVPSEPVLDSMNPLSWWAAGRRVAAFRPDAVVYKWWTPFFAPSYDAVGGAARRAGARVLYVCDNVTPHERGGLDGWLTRWGLSKVDGALVMSESVRQDLLRFRPGIPHRLVKHPLYTQFGEARDRAAARAELGLQGDVILFFGFIRGYKGLDVLLRALGRVRRPVTLCVVGEFYEDRAPYDRLIVDLGLEGRVRVLDRFAGEAEVRTYFSACDAAVLPYKTATQSGVIPLAYAMQCPVITTRVGGLPEVVEEGGTGLLVPPEDPEALAAAIDLFYERGGRDAFVPRILEYRRQFQWDALVTALEELAR
ncbi:MAG: glycosyltransferase [Candidatus Eisenbacteria bacterium]|nr:glycosyltransferase [Candidatus Eisenbacteria bacterium]